MRFTLLPTYEESECLAVMASTEADPLNHEEAGNASPASCGGSLVCSNLSHHWNWQPSHHLQRIWHHSLDYRAQLSA
jgi:hypothetical protein